MAGPAFWCVVLAGSTSCLGGFVLELFSTSFAPPHVSLEAQRCLTGLTRVEDAQDDQRGAVVSILEDVVATQHLQHELPVFFAPRDGATEFGMVV